MSMRQWLGSQYIGVRSQARNIGYNDVYYANGVFVAVGNQKGYPPSFGVPLTGLPVTSAGCSWSPDGIAWTDAQLPFPDRVYSFTSVAGLPSGVWAAVASWLFTDTERYSVIAVSNDNAKTWTAEPTYAGVIERVSAGSGRFMHSGVTASFLPWIHPTTTGFLSQGTTRPIRAPGVVASAFGGNDLFLFMTAERTEVYKAGSWTVNDNVAYGNLINSPVNVRNPRAIAIASDGPLGSAASPVAWALLGIDNPFVTTISRDIWSSGPTGFGSTWVKRATLPAISPLTDYYNLAYNNRHLVAIGDGILMATANGTDWSRIDIPAGRWRGVATDGTDFVCVSQEGDRMKISGAGIDGRIG
jgi:hypothetical protein